MVVPAALLKLLSEGDAAFGAAVAAAMVVDVDITATDENEDDSRAKENVVGIPANNTRTIIAMYRFRVVESEFVVFVTVMASSFMFIFYCEIELGTMYVRTFVLV